MGFGHGHGHSLPASGTAAYAYRRRMGVVLGIIVSITVVQAVGAWLSGSMALLADAAHSLTDGTGVAVALLATIIAANFFTPEGGSDAEGLIKTYASFALAFFFRPIGLRVTTPRRQRREHRIAAAQGCPNRVVDVQADFILALAHTVRLAAEVRQVGDPNDSVERDVFVINDNDWGVHERKQL
jgi:hypothetical protein